MLHGIIKLHAPDVLSADKHSETKQRPSMVLMVQHKSTEKRLEDQMGFCEVFPESSFYFNQANNPHFNTLVHIRDAPVACKYFLRSALLCVLMGMGLADTSDSCITVT
ncbi:hypothetical protein SRHO_G00014470 [Serrasalmus rhombeus]